jgi:hypothetical protein
VDDGEFNESADSLLPNLIIGELSLAEMVDALLAKLHSTDEPDAALCLEVGCGDLESLIRRYEAELWPQIEDLARSDVRFRRALAGVWAYDSSLFDRRDALLKELG